MLICMLIETDQEEVENVGALFHVSSALIEGALEPSFRYILLFPKLCKALL